MKGFARSSVQWTVVEQSKGVSFLIPLVLLDRSCLNGGSGLVGSGVRLVDVGAGSGDSAPCLATTDAGSKSSHE